MFVIPDGDTLVTYLKDFTGSTDDTEIKQCIFQAELVMRNIEIPATRTNPYTTFGTVGDNQMMPIPQDMNKPILFFNQGNNGQQSSSGPWIVYDRIGDRDIITQALIADLYLQPVNSPMVIRGKFSEVGDSYMFLPYLSSGAVLNLYYYRAWNLLFTPAVENTAFSQQGTLTNLIQTGSKTWTATITGLDVTGILSDGSVITAADNTGTLGSGSVTTVTNVDSTSQISVAILSTTNIPVAGTLGVVNLETATTIQTNEVLQSWPEGYIYGALTEYYIKRHSPEDAQIYKAKFDQAWATIENQNNLAKWSGGNTRLTSIWQPRIDRSYAVK